MDSPFDVLGIAPDAEEAAVVRAYRQRVLETHPDHGGSARELQAVREAYERIQAGDAGEEHDTGREPVGEPHRRAASRIEYLDYEVLDDHGWSLDDEDLFEKAAAQRLDPTDHGQMRVRPDESLLEAAENRGLTWPFACRGGACANCAVAVLAGELAQPHDHILPEELLDRSIRLSCNGRPLTDELQVVYNIKHRPDLDDLRLPPGPFEFAHASD